MNHISRVIVGIALILFCMSTFVFFFLFELDGKISPQLMMKYWVFIFIEMTVSIGGLFMLKRRW